MTPGTSHTGRSRPGRSAAPAVDLPALRVGLSRPVVARLVTSPPADHRGRGVLRAPRAHRDGPAAIAALGDAPAGRDGVLAPRPRLPRPGRRSDRDVVRALARDDAAVLRPRPRHAALRARRHVRVRACVHDRLLGCRGDVVREAAGGDGRRSVAPRLSDADGDGVPRRAPPRAGRRARERHDAPARPAEGGCTRPARVGAHAVLGDEMGARARGARGAAARRDRARTSRQGRRGRPLAHRRRPTRADRARGVLRDLSLRARRRRPDRRRRPALDRPRLGGGARERGADAAAEPRDRRDVLASAPAATPTRKRPPAARNPSSAASR